MECYLDEKIELGKHPVQVVRGSRQRFEADDTRRLRIVLIYLFEMRT